MLSARLHPIDLALVGFYLVGITLFGLRFRSRDKSLTNYFLAGRTTPWWAIALSIVSAETSTLTIVSVPGLAFAGNFGFLQIALGYLIGRVVLCLVFLPRYFEGTLLTAYQLIDRRFGPVLHKVTAGLFLITRAAAEGVRVYAISIVVSVAIGTRDLLSIGIISALTLLYTFEGGLAAVIWTDVVQMFLYLGGTVVALLTLGSHVDGGWSTIHAVTSAAGKLHWLDFGFSLTRSYTFWAGVLGGTFLTMASHGTDQLMVQRLLAAKNLRESRLALMASGVVIFVQFTLFLVIGAGLYVFYGQHPQHFASADRIFPSFIVQQMPVGIAGLLIAAVLAAAMSNLSAALNSLSSTTIVDFYLRLRPGATEAQRTILSRASTVMWALVLFAIAAYSISTGGKGHVVETGLSIASVAYGSLLGVFLLGTLTKYATQVGASIGMVFGFGFNLFLWLQPHAIQIGSFTLPKVAFTWYVLFGAIVTFAVGSLASVVAPRRAGVAVMLLVLLFGSATAGAQGPDFSALDALMKDSTSQRHPPGAVLVVGHAGSVAFEHAYGSREIDPAVEAMTQETVFDIASLTKCVVTATAMMQMYEQGRYQMDDPVAKYLPDFGNHGKEQITIRQLMTHHSGLPADLPLDAAWSGKAEAVRLAMTSALEKPPGKVFHYSDINYIVAGLLVEKLSGEPLDVYAQAHIFTPLGMTHTRYLAPASWVPDIAPTAYNDDKPMWPTQGQTLLRGVVHDPTARRMGGVAGHAGVFSTADDLAVFAQALLDRLAGRPSKFPLKTETLQVMCRPEQPVGSRSLRGIGWDIDTVYSRPRGDIFPVGSFGHTGFTGTSMWMDPRTDTYVVLMANSIHPHVGFSMTPLRGRVATEAAKALHLYERGDVKTGVDVLESDHAAVLRDARRVGLLTNQTGLDAKGRRTVDVLAHDAGVKLVTLFSPEHGIAGAEDKEGIGNSVDKATGVPVVSLYGAKPADRRPTHAQLKDLDAVVIDLQDAGVRFYTYETVVGYFLEAADAEKRLGHSLSVIVLDRPALASGVQVGGPVLDAGAESYTAYMHEPVQHGMTLGELAKLMVREKKLDVALTVVPMRGWQRGLWFDQTGVPWVNPSPNLRNLNAAALYPGISMLETANLSVGRGTDAPLEQIAASWIGEADAQTLADALNGRKLMGVTFAATSFTPDAPAYPDSGKLCHGVRMTVTDRTRFDAPEMAVELMAALWKQFPAQFKIDKTMTLVGNRATIDAVKAGRDPKEIAAGWEDELAAFRERREAALIYGYLPQ